MRVSVCHWMTSESDVTRCVEAVPSVLSRAQAAHDSRVK